MRGDSPDLDGAALAYATELTAVLGSPPHLDLVLLGVGADGHVASLFPDRPVVWEDEGFVVAVRDAPKPPPERLTLTMRTLMAARSLCIAAFEPEKAAVLRAALRSPDAGSPIPVARLIAAHPDVTLMFSGAAGL
jgi:6-phosphogluconolactonase